MWRLRISRLMLAVVAGYELRGLAGCLGHAVARVGVAPSPGLLLLSVLALITGWMLLQAARGLDRVAVLPRWALRLVGIALMVGSAPVVALSGGDALAGHSLLGPSGLTGASAANLHAALGIAVVFAAAGAGAWWLSRHPVNVLVRPLGPGVDPPGPGTAVSRRAAPPPLLAGWSGRGPPPLPV